MGPVDALPKNDISIRDIPLIHGLYARILFDARQKIRLFARNGLL